MKDKEMIEFEGKKYDRFNYFVFQGILINHCWNQEPITVVYTNYNLQLFFTNGSYSVNLYDQLNRRDR